LTEEAGADLGHLQGPDVAKYRQYMCPSAMMGKWATPPSCRECPSPTSSPWCRPTERPSSIGAPTWLAATKTTTSPCATSWSCRSARRATRAGRWRRASRWPRRPSLGCVPGRGARARPVSFTTRAGRARSPRLRRPRPDRGPTTACPTHRSPGVSAGVGALW